MTLVKEGREAGSLDQWFDEFPKMVEQFFPEFEGLKGKLFAHVFEERALSRKMEKSLLRNGSRAVFFQLHRLSLLEGLGENCEETFNVLDGRLAEDLKFERSYRIGMFGEWLATTLVNCNISNLDEGVFREQIKIEAGRAASWCCKAAQWEAFYYQSSIDRFNPYFPFVELIREGAVDFRLRFENGRDFLDIDFLVREPTESGDEVKIVRYSMRSRYHKSGKVFPPVLDAKEFIGAPKWINFDQRCLRSAYMC